jgi:hypothetical protein
LSRRRLARATEGEAPFVPVETGMQTRIQPHRDQVGPE